MEQPLINSAELTPLEKITQYRDSLCIKGSPLEDVALCELYLQELKTLCKKHKEFPGLAYISPQMWLDNNLDFFFPDAIIRR